MNRATISIATGLASLACLSACGSSGSPGSAKDPSPVVSRGTSTAATAPPATKPAPSGSEAVASACAAKSGDPADVMICMASHHIVVKDSPALRTCLASTHGASGIIDCLTHHAG